MDDVHCDEEDTATTRGRTTAHEVCHFQKTLHDVLANKRRTQLSRRLMIKLKSIKAHKRNNTSFEMYLFTVEIQVLERPILCSGPKVSNNAMWY